MSNNTVHALFFSRPAGLGFGFGAEQLKGLFETRELAEKRLLEEVLGGGMIASARIDELTIEQAYDEKNPLNYPDVIAALIQQKKIQAIRNLRTHVPGLGLREAKDAVEAVNLLELPEALRVEAQKIVSQHEAEAAEEKRRRDELSGRFTPVADFCVYTFIRDGDDDIWAHNGNGKYVLLNDFGGRDSFQEEHTEDEIERIFGIINKSDERDDV